MDLKYKEDFSGCDYVEHNNPVVNKAGSVINEHHSEANYLMEYKSNGHACVLLLTFTSLSFGWLVSGEELDG